MVIEGHNFLKLDLRSYGQLLSLFLLYLKGLTFMVIFAAEEFRTEICF